MAGPDPKFGGKFRRQAKARDFLVLTFGDLPQQLLEVSGGVGGRDWSVEPQI